MPYDNYWSYFGSTYIYMIKSNYHYNWKQFTHNTDNWEEEALLKFSKNVSEEFFV